MRNPSIRHCGLFAVAVTLALTGSVARAATLALSAARLNDPHASARDVRVVVEEHANGASLHVSAARIDVPELGLGGRLDWTCTLRRGGVAEWACAGPIQLATDGAALQTADLTARIADHHIDLALARDGSRVAVTLPLLAADTTSVSLRQVPAAWFRALLALAWKGGEVRGGVFDATATIAPDGRVQGHFKAADLTFNTLDGTVSGASVAIAGRLGWSRVDADTHLAVSATWHGGTLALGAVHVTLPQIPITMDLDATAREGGRWDISHLAWSDPAALEFEASGSFESALLAPLRTLDVHIRRALFPLAQERYAQAVLAAQGLAKLTLRGELSGDLAIDAHGVQRIALVTPKFNLDDGNRRVALAGIKGGIDWAASGTQPATALAWKSATIGGVNLPASTSRWQSRDGALVLLGSLRTKLLGGALSLEETVLRPQSTAKDRLSTTFAIRDVGYDSKDGSIAAAHLAAAGRLQLSGSVQQPHVQVDARFTGGEMLAGPLYVKLPDGAVKAKLDMTFSNARWRIDQFDWDDPGVLQLGASGEIGLADVRPVHALQLELRDANLAPALARYAQSWLAAKGYGELTVDGTLSGALQFDAAGLQRFAFTAHSVDAHDGGGRFMLTGLDGSIDWDMRADTPSSALGWTSAELFRIPLGAVRAAFESRGGQIVLAQPVAVDVLGGQVRLEKLSLQPRSPSGERYAGSFAIVAVDMAKLSTVFGWPRFGGNLSGGIPEIVFSGDTIELHGGLDLYVFDGHLGVSGLTLQRPFGVAPALGANIHFERFDLEQVTQAFSFGGMSGRLDGTIANLRLLDWSPVAFDAWLHADAGGRMSYNAVNDLTAIGGGGGQSASLETVLLKMFNTFGYRRLGIRCKLRDEVCAMAGIAAGASTGATDSATDGYTIVEGSGVPQISIVGHRHRVDWPTLVRRLIEATQGHGPVIR